MVVETSALVFGLLFTIIFEISSIIVNRIARIARNGTKCRGCSNASTSRVLFAEKVFVRR